MSITNVGVNLPLPQSDNSHVRIHYQTAPLPTPDPAAPFSPLTSCYTCSTILLQV
jgi:hypothetical protein